MSKAGGPKSLADQLLALAKDKLPSKTAADGPKKRAPSTVKPKKAGGIDVSDMEAAMAQKHATAERKEAGARQRGKSKKRKSPPAFEREVRRKMPDRSIDISRKHEGQKPSTRRLTGNLKPEVQKRFELPPKSEADDQQSSAVTTPKLQPARASAQQANERRAPQDPWSPPTEAKDAFDKISAIVGASVPEIEPRPKIIDEFVAKDIDHAIGSGAAWLHNNPEPELDGDAYVVGIDFGTSSLKIVLRDPYAADEPVAAIPAPIGLRSQAHPYLWQTVVWYSKAKDRFSLCPSKGALVLEGFKTGLITGRGGEPISQDPQISRALSATAFLALHLCHLTGWFQSKRPLANSNAEKFLSMKIGIPIATNDDPVALQQFTRIVAAAYKLSTSCEAMTFENVTAAYTDASSAELPAGFYLVPELSAALVGYANAATSKLGSHVLVDVGASTLDIVAFNLLDQSDGHEIKAFAASVELLGAAALDVAKKKRISSAAFLKACNFQFGDTYSYASRPDVADDCFSPVKRRSAVQLVITGGGCNTKQHSKFVNSLPERLLGEQTIERPLPPAKIAEETCDLSRLLLAYGLAHDDPEMPEPTLPSRIPTKPVLDSGGPTAITKDQM